MPDGSALRVRVPAGAQGGRKLSVRGRGMPGKPPGDLHLRVRVVLPAASDAAARDCYEKMAELFPDFDARRAAEADGG
jgi:curved DNA-binding protein